MSRLLRPPATPLATCFACASLSTFAYAAPPTYRVVPLLSHSAISSLNVQYLGLDDSNNAYIGLVDDNPATDYYLRWDGTSLQNYLPSPYGVASVSHGGQLGLQTFSNPTHSAVRSLTGEISPRLAPPGLPAGTGVFIDSVNSSGTAAGQTWDGGPVFPRITTWDTDGTPHDLGIAPTGNTIARISDSGILFGETSRQPIDTYPGTSSLGFVGWGDQMQLISVPGSNAVTVPALNASGTAIVQANFPLDSTSLPFRIHGYIWRDGVLTYLPDIPNPPYPYSDFNVPLSINDAGYIVGHQGDAVLWEPDLTPHFLSDLLTPEDASTWFVQAAYDINNSGVILAEVGRRYLNPDGIPYLDEPALLIPISIPEPTTLLGFAPLLSLRRPNRRRNI